MAGMERKGGARSVLHWIGWERQEWNGSDSKGPQLMGMEWQEWMGMDRSGLARKVRERQEWLNPVASPTTGFFLRRSDS